MWEWRILSVFWLLNVSFPFLIGEWGSNDSRHLIRLHRAASRRRRAALFPWWSSYRVPLSFWILLGHPAWLTLQSSSKLDLPIEISCFGFSVCIGFIGFDKLSSVCKIYLSNQAAEGAILLLHSIPRTLAATASLLRVWFATPPKHKTSWCPNKGSSY